MADLLGDWRTSVYNSIHRGLTGRPTPGSLEDLRQKKEKLDALRLLQGPPKPAPAKTIEQEVQERLMLGRVNNQLENERQTSNLPVLSSYLGIRNQGLDSDANRNILVGDANTRNKIAYASGIAQSQSQLLQQLLDAQAIDAANERAVTNDYINYAATRDDKSLQAQRNALWPSILGGLGLTALALFA